MDETIDAILGQMTLEEKLSLLAGADTWLTVPVKRLGIPAMKTTDGPMGARGADDATGPTSACFPCGVALGATWNPELVESVGQALAEETRSKGAHILLAPTVNVHRSPLAGRNFEYYSEDPYLIARMATAYITGLQSKGVGACIKHFVCNDSEFERTSLNSEVDERTLREIYLRPFEIALRDARPWAVMSSYNRVNGVYACENDYLLRDILKGEWGFDGLVISDWYGTYDRDVVKGGLDLEMPGPARWMGTPARQAVQRDEVREEAIDDKVRRLLRTIQRVGALDHPDLVPEQGIDRPEHRRVAYRAAAEAIVLLKNEQAVLPLDSAKSIAVIGENARLASYSGGGSVRVHPHYVVSPLQAIKKKTDARVEYAIGCATHKNPPLIERDWLSSPLTLQYFGNRTLTGDSIHSEKTTRSEWVWFGNRLPYVEMNNFSVRAKGTITPSESGVYELTLACTGGSRLYIDDKPVIDLWQGSGKEDNVGSAEVELAKGRSYQLEIEYAAEPGVNWRHLRLGCTPRIPADSIAQAVALAARSDVAIVFAGLTSEWESEGFDRPDMELPGDQAKLIEQVAAANPNTIVILNAGSPLSMNWLDRVAGVVQCWYLGQETGNAIADVLFGDVNPSGKLPTTFPKRLQDNPAYLNYPGENGKVCYGEGLFVGYRYYEKKDIAPLFPFGFGLSYTTFAYRRLVLSAPEYAAGDEICVSVEIENTGPRSGQEVVQLYVRDIQSRLVRPEKELKAFAKVALEPGESKTVTFNLDEQALSFYDPSVKRWVAQAGEFQVLVGSSSRDIQLKENFNLRN